MSTLVTTIPLSSRRWSRSVVLAGSAARHKLAPLVDGLAHGPEWLWPLCATLAAWPSLAWALRRFGDRSDDPFGIVAWCALLFALVVSRARFAHPPRLVALAASASAALLAASPGGWLPDLVRACVATCGIVAALAAIVDDDEPFVPYIGFALLALPLLSSLQFYAGFPLRVVTAEASRWLLSIGGAAVARDGSALLVDGRLVLVDAPCSGVQMAWVGYFTACFAAWLFRTADGAMLRRMPLVGALILGGNVVRNTILVALEAHGGVDDATHATIGLVVVAVVCTAIVALFAGCRVRVRALQRIRVEPGARFFAPPDTRSSAIPLLAAAVFVVAGLLPFARAAVASPVGHPVVEWPTTLDGDALVPVALPDVERRFAGDFPGVIARFTAGSRVVVLREVERPTRRLHPAVDCYRALGYAIDHEHLERAEDGLVSRCFEARRKGRGLRVCERIVDVDGKADTDVSSWYWHALLGRSHGPWRASTIAMPLDGAVS